MQTVLITGASTGIGHAAALRLAAKGIHVFAGVRSAQAGNALREAGGANVTPLELEVTDAASIERARQTVQDALPASPLQGLVNNAGISIPGPLELLSDADLHKQFEVNFFGAMATTRAFLPLLRRSRGRVINISSIAGKCSVPFVGAYAASKFALEGASDALRLELAPFGVRVILIEPGAVATPIWQRGGDLARAVLAQLSPEQIAPYREALERFSTLATRSGKGGISPHRVAAVIDEALFGTKPRARYLVGNDARVQLMLARLPEGLRDRIFMR
ncbi:MAG TPA: SDR family oxidoreductase, partial [Candidatus Baltobacteraceae bacterium]